MNDFWKLELLCQSMANALKLSNLIADRAILILRHAHARSLISLGLRGRRAVPGALYLAARSQAIPISLLEVCQVAEDDDDWQAITKSIPMLMQVCQEDLQLNLNTVDPLLYLERYASSCQFDRKELGMAAQLVEVAKEGWLNEGRQVQPLSLACLLLSHAHHQRIRLDGPTVKRYSEACSLVPKTVTSRLHELESLLLEQSKQLPWPVEAKQLHLHLADILRFTTPTLDLDPPSLHPLVRDPDSIEGRMEETLILHGLDPEVVRRANGRKLQSLFMDTFYCESE